MSRLTARPATPRPSRCGRLEKLWTAGDGLHVLAQLTTAMLAEIEYAGWARILAAPPPLEHETHQIAGRCEFRN